MVRVHTPKPGYSERSKSQLLSWAMGRPYHNDMDGECCPDFSCCHPGLFTKNEDERWELYRKRTKPN